MFNFQEDVPNNVGILQRQKYTDKIYQILTQMVLNHDWN